MKRSKLKEVFDRVMASWPNISSLICFTEAVFITNPSLKEIKTGFYRLVDKADYKGFERNDILKDTFGDMLSGAKTLPNERLSASNY